MWAVLQDLITKFLTSGALDKEVKESLSSPYVINNGILSDVRKEWTDKRGGKITGPRFIVIHYTAGNNPENTVRIFKNNSVSAHIVIDRQGKIIQMVNFLRKAWHAGKSTWTSKWGTRHSGLNKYAIGIELSNYGYYRKQLGDIDQSDWLTAVHKNGGPVRKWQPYTEDQFDATVDVVSALMKEYDIPPEHVIGHDDISPDRKVDPGPAFDINRLRDLVGGRA